MNNVLKETPGNCSGTLLVKRERMRNEVQVHLHKSSKKCREIRGGGCMGGLNKHITRLHSQNTECGVRCCSP